MARYRVVTEVTEQYVVEVEAADEADAADKAVNDPEREVIYNNDVSTVVIAIVLAARLEGPPALPTEKEI